jgi:hypothetical protein
MYFYASASTSKVEVKAINVITITIQKVHEKSSAVQGRPRTNSKVKVGSDVAKEE